ncbi:MAG: Vitamin B12 transporter BtuB [Acidobacteria bacterium]|nr:Vitamin B12 transporter BtuB [Acidobacteriota bacterium]
MESLFRSSAIIILSLFVCVSAIAQSRGSLRGVVVDARGAAVRGARVILLINDRQAIRETVTNEQGQFGWDGLKPGAYSLSVEADGLTQTGGSQPVEVAAGREYRVAIPLTVAAIEDSMVISATRTEARTGEMPAKTFVVSANELLNTQRINLFDALRLSPGVAVAQTGRRGGVTSLFVRGGESDYTKVLIDGVPVNEAGGSYDFADLTTDNATRVELVRGAQSAIYGSDAMAGVLQVFTHRGSTSVPEFEFAGEGGSFAFNRQFGRVSGANGGFDYSLSFTHLRTDGRDRNDDYQNRIATANLGYIFNTRTQIRLTARNDKSGLGAPGATAVLFPDPDERAKRRRIATGFRLDDQTAKSWRQSLSFAYSESNYLSFDPAAQDLTKPNTPPDPGVAFNDFVNYFNNHQRRRSLRYQTDLILPAGHFILAGIEYEQERAVFDSGFAGLNRVAPDRKNLGAFIQDQFAYTSRLFITAGIRVENNRADVPANLTKILSDLGSKPYTGEVGFGTEVMPKLAAILTIRHAGLQSLRGPTRLRVNYGEGIKAPTMIEAFSPNPFFLGNAALKPERSRNFDIGIEQFFWKDRVRIEGIYFVNRFRDQIAFIADPTTFGGPVKLADGRMTHFINNDRATAQGFELAASWHPKRWLRFDGNYTLLDTNLDFAADVIDFATLKLVPNREVGLPLLRRPRHSGSISVAYIGDRFNANLDGLFIGKRRDGDPVSFLRFDPQGRPIYNNGYAKLDLAGAYRFNSYISAFARIENLLNQDYQEVLGYPAYRLNFSAGMRFRIGGGK